METDAADPPRATRPRPFLIVLFGIVLVAYLLMRLGGPTVPGGTPATPARVPQPTGADANIDPARLDVQLEALTADRPGPADTERNPFRFKPRASAQPTSQTGQPGTQTVAPELAPSTPGPPPVPPITVRFIGQVVKADGSRLAVFVDCSVGRKTSHAREGEIVDGRFRLVKIGLESVVVEHLDGTGRTTLSQSGQECVK